MRTFLPAAFIILTAASAPAQTFEGASAAQKAIQETGRLLRQADSNATSEAVRQMAERAADGGRLGRLADEARKKMATSGGDDGRKLISAADQKLEPALRSAAPEGRAIIAQSAAAPAARAPGPNVPKGGAPSRPRSESGTPGVKKGRAAAPPPSTIDILSEGAVYLDSAQALAVFTDDVVLDHPQFHMTCDKLEVYFLKGGDKKAAEEKDGAGAKAPEPGAPPRAQPADRPAPQTDEAKLKQAIASGKKVVISKLDENGQPQIGICRQATYMGDSGDVIMREMPQVQRGNNIIIARDASTYMVMKQNGELKVHGPADTKIQQSADAVGKAKPAGADSTAGAAGGVTLTPKKPDKK